VATVARPATVETERLLLEPWSEERLEDFVRLAGDPRVTGHFGEGHPWSRRRSEARFAEAVGHWSRYGFGWRSAIERSSGEWLGFVGLNFARPESIELAPRSVEIGWWLDPSVWGRGYATEGALALRDEGFERVGLDRLWARYQVANNASARVAEKIGMRPDGVTAGRHGEEMQLTVLTRDRWERIRDPALT
jgi:[ribosomal protein S5]-alanine N-acetyltransferase